MLVLGLCVPAVEVIFRFVLAERVGTLLLSLVVAHVSWHWMAERWVVFSQYRIPWPALSIGLFVTLLGWLILALLVGGLGWLAFGKLWNPAARGVAGAAAAPTAAAPTEE